MWDEKVVRHFVELTRQEYETSKMVDYFAEQTREGLSPDEEKAASLFLKPPADLLVLACGSGRECFPLVRKGFRVAGLDISKNMLREARQFQKQWQIPAAWIEGTFLQLPFKSGCFDALLLGLGMYAAIPSKKLRCQTLKEMARLLKPGGVLILTMGWVAEKKRPFYHSWPGQFLKMLKKRIFDRPLQEAGDTVMKNKRGEIVSFTHFFQRPEEIAAEFRRAGLGVLHREGFAWVLQPSLLKTSFISK